MRLSHKRKIKEKKQGKNFKCFVMATGKSSIFSFGKSSRKNISHRYIIGSSREGKVGILVRKHGHYYVITNGKSKLTGSPTFENPIEARDVESNKVVRLYFNEKGDLVGKNN